MDFNAIKKAAQGYEKDMTKFLREIVVLSGESCGEEGHIRRIEKEMKDLGFDKVQIDPMGNVMGWMGKGKTLIAFDAHIDTVGIGEKSNWKFDPYQGYENETEIGGRGTSDQLGGIVSAVYGAKIMKDLGLLSDKYTVLVTGTVQEEDCDGLCWQYIVNEDKVRPEFVVITEPTDGNIYRGQRGRMEIRVEVKGVSATAPPPNAETTPSTRWPTSFRKSAHSTTGSTTTRSSARVRWPSRRASTTPPRAAPWPTCPPSPSTAGSPTARPGKEPLRRSAPCPPSRNTTRK